MYKNLLNIESRGDGLYSVEFQYGEQKHKYLTRNKNVLGFKLAKEKDREPHYKALWKEFCDLHALSYNPPVVINCFRDVARAINNGDNIDWDAVEKKIGVTISTTFKVCKYVAYTPTDEKYCEVIVRNKRGYFQHVERCRIDVVEQMWRDSVQV